MEHYITHALLRVVQTNIRSVLLFALYTIHYIIAGFL